MMWLAIMLAFLQGGATLQGTVLRAANNPLSRASVELRTENDDRLLDTITTEDDGRFFFRNVRPGRYRLTVTRSGYFRAPLPITVDASGAANVTLTMAPTASISGRVFGANGEPLPNVEVQALRISYAYGQRTLTMTTSSQTNDLGEYRLFWLTPGRYYVVMQPASLMKKRMMSFGIKIGGAAQFSISAQNLDPATELSVIGDPATNEQFVPIYFSGTIDERGASPIDLRAGAEVIGVNLTVAPVREARIRGIVIGAATGRPVEYGTVTADENREPGRRNEARVNPETGAFEMKLLPGPHVLAVTSEAGSAYVPLYVGNSDIDGLAIRVSPEFDVRGRIVVEGGARAGNDFEALRLSLERDPPPARTRPNPSTFSVPLDDGTFTLAAGLGDYRLILTPILSPPNPLMPPSQPAWRDAYVKSIRLGDVDVLNGGLHLEKQPEASLEIVIATNPGALRVRSASDVSVIIVPENRRRTDLYRTATTDATGRVTLDRLPPGVYKVFAWQDADSSVWYDPDFIRNYEAQGRSVRIAEGTTAEVEAAMVAF